jgi:hypothetical protein
MRKKPFSCKRGEEGEPQAKTAKPSERPGSTDELTFLFGQICAFPVETLGSSLSKSHEKSNFFYFPLFKILQEDLKY